MSRSVSAHLADWVAGLKPEHLDVAAERAAIDTVIDVLGLCVAARKTDYTIATMEAFGDSGDCTVIAQDRRLSPMAAAAINGTAAHGEDFDNTFEGCPVHSGAVIVPAALAIAEQAKADGPRTVLAITAGIEVMCRLGLIADKSVHKAGFHPTAVLGTFAAAVSAAIVKAADDGVSYVGHRLRAESRRDRGFPRAEFSSMAWTDDSGRASDSPSPIGTELVGRSRRRGRAPQLDCETCR